MDDLEMIIDTPVQEWLVDTDEELADELAVLGYINLLEVA